LAATTIHVHPTAPLAERALLPGDPGRALVLAQALLDEPRMFNHNRGLWGYTGTAGDGQPLTIQATGLGGPSAAIVLEELATLGLRRAVRVGTCAALDARLALGELVCATSVIGRDGASRALGAPERQAPDPDLTAALGAAADHAGAVVSTDLYYPPQPSEPAAAAPAAPGRGRDDPPPRAGSAAAAPEALATELDAAALLAVGARRGVRVGCVLAVTHAAGRDGRIAHEALVAAAERLGRAGLAALTAPPGEPG
jgi:uridine phosphorylase